MGGTKDIMFPPVQKLEGTCPPRPPHKLGPWVDNEIKLAAFTVGRLMKTYLWNDHKFMFVRLPLFVRLPKQCKD